MTTDAILDELLVREGGYVDHPADRGGPTKFGITLATAQRFRKAFSIEDLKTLPAATAREIYQHEYIERPGFTPANIPHEAVRVAVIDEGVNAGPVVAMRHLQTAVNVVRDGRWGPITRAQVAAADPNYLVKELVRLRLLRYARICQRDATQLVFFAGWVTRALSLL